MSYYYRMEQEPTSVLIADEPREISGAIEISEEDYYEMLAQRAESDISKEVQYAMPRSIFADD